MSKLSVVNHRDAFISDILTMITGGTSNDVKFVLKDGEILANKDVLSARSDYFATMFSNNEVKFIEGETNTVRFTDCNKSIMEKIVIYLFSGEMKLQDMSLSDLVMMMNMAAMMMLVALKNDIQRHLLDIIPKSGEDGDALPELVKSLMLAEQLKLDTVKNALVRELYKSLVGVDSDCVAMKQISCNLLKEIMFYGKTEENESDDDEDDPDLRTPSTKNLFDAFVLWLSENDCTDEDKKDITDSFVFEDFKEQELLTDVRKSGLYSIEKIDRRALDIFNFRSKIIAEQRNDLKSKEATLRIRDATIKEKSIEWERQEKRIMRLTQDIQFLRNKGKKC